MLVVGNISLLYVNYELGGVDLFEYVKWCVSEVEVMVFSKKIMVVVKV